MVSLFFRNLLFTILQPGVVAGLIPFWILGKKAKEAFDQSWLFYHYAGLVMFTAGLAILMICIVSFAIHGRGTLSPADPTKKLVTLGLYKFSRNPMYVGVTLVLMAESIFFQSFELAIYCIFIFAAFNIFIILVEEPRLRRDFGEEYHRYCQNVRRWI